MKVTYTSREYPLGGSENSCSIHKIDYPITQLALRQARNIASLRCLHSKLAALRRRSATKYRLQLYPSEKISLSQDFPAR